MCPGAATARGGVWSGFVTALSNPGHSVLCRVFPQFIQITSDVGLSLGLLSIIWVAIDLGVLSFYILAIRRWLAPAHTIA
jgi:threonine/homoserine/homoserine lactone efflux protein